MFRNRFFLIACLFTLFSSSALGQSKTVTFSFPPVERVWNPTFQGKPERTVEELEHKLSDASRLGDKATLESLLAENLMILGVSYSKQQWIQLLVNGVGSLRNYEKRVTRIQIYGGTAVVTGSQLVDSVTSNSSSSYQYNFMDTWIKTKSGSWQCVAIAGDQVKARD